MGNVYAELNERLRELILAQHVFFVATAPLAASGHVNLSPKGLDAFRILDDRTVAYLDLVGSGIETVSHVRENGRIVLMFCSFSGAPRIVRLYGIGRVVEPGDPAWSELAGVFPHVTCTRSIIVIDLERVADSCGFGVPLYEYRGERSQLIDYSDKLGVEKLADFKRKRNRFSIDGLPGLPSLAEE